MVDVPKTTTDREPQTPTHSWAGSAGRSRVLAQMRAMLSFFARPVDIVRSYKAAYLRPDLIAGLTVAVITLPQAVAYALIAELPPQFGLYAAIVGSIVGSLWGSSDQLQTGPSNAASLLVLSVLLAVATPGTPEYLTAAGLMAVIVGLVRLLMGLARLGMLVNFVSDSVIVGFTAGAGMLIFGNQVRHLLRLNIPSSPSLWETVPGIVTHLRETHWPSLLIGGGVIVLIGLLRRVSRKLPGPLIAMVVASGAVATLRLDALGVRTIGELPRGFPPLAKLPLFDLTLIGRLGTGAIAAAVIGLVEAVSISRSIASHTGQRLDSNQEFVGQGMANIATGFLSGYMCSGSFARSALNFEAGAKTAFASVFGGTFVLISMVALAPLAVHVPLAALAGVLLPTALGLIDRRKISRIWKSGRGDRQIMVSTMLATLVLPLQFAVLAGIVLSLTHYLLRTSTPRVRNVLPDANFRHFAHQPEKPGCPQLCVIEILGDLYFGAANHVEERILSHLKQHPEQRYLLLRMHAVEHCDISGIHTLESIVRTYRKNLGDVYLVRVRRPVMELMRASGFHAYLGEDHFLDPDRAIESLFYRVIDPAICIYECPFRAFLECQNLPKRSYGGDIHLDVQLPPGGVPGVTAQALWTELHGQSPPQIIDVREPREFKRAHIPNAQAIPLPVLLEHMDQVPHTRPVVLVCRGGRRSERATALLREQGYDNVRVLKGGMIAWEQENLLEAVS